ncbi:MAG: recombinase family protein [Moorellaceae bacterium]
MKTAIAYARFSSDSQREESITAQLRAIREYALKNDIQIVREYTDEARSATTDDRPGFLQMIADLKNGLKVDLVLVHKLDRFARNRYDAAVYRKEIQKAGAKLVAVDQPLDDSPESVLLESLLEGLAEYYSKNLAREVMKGMKENALVAKFNGGWVPYGYSIVDGKYVINETEAEAVKLIFTMAHQGKSYSTICQELQNRGFLSRRGKPFSTTAIHEILRNPKYMGVYIFNRAPRRIDGKRNWRRAKSPEEIIEVPGGVPAIIDEKIFREVQEILDKRKIGPRQREDIIYILTGKLVCGLCGSPCVGNSRRRAKEGKIYRYYECNSKLRKEGCQNPPWRKEELEGIVLDYIKTEIFGAIEPLTERLYMFYQKKNLEGQHKLQKLRKEIDDLTAKINNLLDLVEIGNADPRSIGPRINKYQARKVSLEQELSILQHQQIKYTKKMIREYLESVRKDLAGQLGPDEARKIVDSFVEKINLYPDKAEVLLKIRLCADKTGVGGGT